jgi:hypothetical protein
MKRFGVILLLLSSAAWADTAALTWAQPTAREDGSALPLTEIQGYRLVWTLRGVAQPAKMIPVGTAYTLDTGTVSGKVCVTLYTVDTDGLESDPSVTVCRNARPNRPVLLTVK